MDKKVEIGEMEFARLETGIFSIGALTGDEFATSMELNHMIEISKEFYIQTTPVTVKQYFLFIEETGYEHEYNIEIWNGNEWIEGPHFMDINGRGDDFPIVGVSYVDAEKYIEWASNKYQVMFRLPTEAEYEVAARDNCNCISECYYASEVRKLGLVREEGKMPTSAPSKVKSGVKTLSGLYDMHGLIWQWCSDWFFYYNVDEYTDPKGPKEQPGYAPWKGEQWAAGKVIRGGSFSYPYYHSRCSNRHYSKISDRNCNLGFRLCF